ncbi:uncharacterized protein DDB_G0283357-like [Culicoides brevitarsis]|uniref:uncharacterized protein DDB_G0283357-like n=1 Tax=Culicoides brevitarsis TaxID=469753 RepID=UPI00307B90D6
MKRKKKDEEDGKEPKPKKYKKKIENPEKKRARYVYDNKANNGKVWEKNRRDRLNTTFDDLSLLLPPKDPPGKMSKVEILVAAIKEIGDLRKKLQDLDQNVSYDKTEQIKVIPEIKDVACNTDFEDKENLIKPKIVHKKIQVNMLKKKKKKILPAESNELNVSSSETQTSEVTKNDENPTVDSNKTSEPNSMALVPFSASSNSVESVQTSSIATSHLSTTMRMTPALISTPIMTPSLFISNYPFVVSQIPQPVLIVNNKTEVNTTVNKVVTVASKSANGRVPLPPLKKTVAVKKIPRKKRILKKKVVKEAENQNSSNEQASNRENMENKSQTETGKDQNSMEKEIKINTEIITVNRKQEDFPKESEQVVNKPLEEIPLPITPLPISSGKLIERLDSNSSLLNAQDTSNINDTSGISNLDIDNFSLLTANILSGIDANDTNLSSNLGKILEDKDLECSSKNSSLMNLPAEIASKDKSIEKSNVIEKLPETKPRETIQVRKGLLQSEHKIPNEHSSMDRRAESMLIPTTSSFDNNFNALSITSQSNNYPNFALSLASQDKSRAKAVSESNITSTSSTTYTMSVSTYSGNINYSGYYSNSNTSLQQLYNNQHPNNIISSSYSNSYESQRPYYADQPSTNFTFSLTSVAKSHAKYVSSGTKSQNMIPAQAANIQEPCKKFTSKSSTYYSTENNTVKNVTSHSIARLNSKYDNHKENDTPFYLSQDAPSCTKSNVVQKLTYNQPVFSNNSSCARYPQQSQQQLPSGSKQTTSNKNVKSSSISSTQQPQMSSRYDVDWMSSSEIKPSTNDFQLFPSLESSTMNQNSYYSSSISNFEINRKTSDLYFAHPPGEENLPWSPSRMSMLDAQHLGGNQCFSSTLPNLHGELGLNTLSGGNSSRPSSIFETPTKSSSLSSYNASYSATKESKRISNNVESQQNNSFSVRQLVDINQSSTNKSTTVPTNDKCVKRKSSGRKEGEVDTFSSDINPYDNPKSNIYSAESLINPRHGSKNKSWHTESSHAMTSGESANQNNPLFAMEPTAENQYNYSTTRYDPKFFKQNYVTSFVDNSFSNNSQNYHNFSKSQPFTFGETNNPTPTLDYHQSSLGNSMNSFLPHHEMPEKQHYYSHTQPSASSSSSSKSINPLSTNMDTISSRSNNQSTSHKKSSKSSSSHHVPSSTSHHSLIMNYDFPVPPVTPSLSYFSTHDWKSTPTEPYPSMHPNSCNTNSYVNSSYSQNILQNSQSQNLVTGLPSSNLNSSNNNGGNNNSHSQNTSNSLTNFNLSTICPEINDKVRQQNW